MEERTITEQAVPVTICPPKISLDKSEAIAKEQKKKKDNLLEQKFSEYCQNLNMFLEGRVFIPEAKEYDVLFLADRLTAFLKERTGINYISYYFERKEVKGIFIMKSEILLDKERQYTYSNDIVYDENGIAYHVSYYEEKGVLRIILDNSDSGNALLVFTAILAVSAFVSVILAYKIKKRKNDLIYQEKLIAEYIEEETKNLMNKKLEYFERSIFIC